MYKIASFEITDIPLIEYTASKKKPIIISTGIASLTDIEEAVNACRRVGNSDITLLKCTSSYPAPVDEANLLTIPNLRETFGVKVGLSDHTMGADVAIAAVAVGAKVIEKHFILDRKLGGPDAKFSMEPAEFKSMVDSIRNVEKDLGKVSYDLSEKTKKSREFSRSLFVVKDIKAGEEFTKETLQKLIPEHASYNHSEGNSNAHIKASLLGSSVTVLVSGGKLVLGTWQHIFFYEGDGPRKRRIYVHLSKEK